MTDHAHRFRTAREALVDLLSDGQFHSWKECAARAGIRFGARLLEIRRAGGVIEDRPCNEGKAYRLVSIAPANDCQARRRLLLSPDDIASIARGIPSTAARREAEKAMGRR